MSVYEPILMALTKDKYVEQYTQRVEQNYTEQLDKVHRTVSGHTNPNQNYKPR